ncbi:MAG: HAD family hydrolase [Silvanigrellales bacterium]|nr:HAD family hydrolase [Silvanigrellales bacterium]
MALRTIHAFPAMVALVKELSLQGVPLVLATNPFVPRASVEQRLARAGLSFNNFQDATFAENSRFLKPSAYYYEDILHRLGLPGRDVVMIGNDAVRDGAARQVGIRTVIVSPHKGDEAAAKEARSFLWRSRT